MNRVHLDPTRKTAEAKRQYALTVYVTEVFLKEMSQKRALLRQLDFS